MRAAGELQPPVGYDDRWLLLALAGLAVVAVYYLVVLWWGRRRPERAARAADPALACLARLDEIEADVAAGRATPRAGHQALSRAVREFVATTAGVPARSMTLADFEREGPQRVAEVVALVYAPAFAPGGGAGHDLAAQRLAPALARARELVSSWS